MRPDLGGVRPSAKPRAPPEPAPAPHALDWHSPDLHNPYATSMQEYARGLVFSAHSRLVATREFNARAGRMAECRETSWTTRMGLWGVS
jgi:hypothetical protein